MISRQRADPVVQGGSRGLAIPGGAGVFTVELLSRASRVVGCRAWLCPLCRAPLRAGMGAGVRLATPAALPVWAHRWVCGQTAAQGYSLALDCWSLSQSTPEHCCSLGLACFPMGTLQFSRLLAWSQLQHPEHPGSQTSAHRSPRSPSPGVCPEDLSAGRLALALGATVTAVVALSRPEPSPQPGDSCCPSLQMRKLHLPRGPVVQTEPPSEPRASTPTAGSVGAELRWCELPKLARAHTSSA